MKKIISPGFIYIMSNPSMSGVVKIGKTTQSPFVRAKELSTTGVPQPFEVEWFQFVNNHDVLEREVHRFLSEYRVNNNREFFKIEIEACKRKVKRRIAGSVLSEFDKIKGAEGAGNLVHDDERMDKIEGLLEALVERLD